MEVPQAIWVLNRQEHELAPAAVACEIGGAKVVTVRAEDLRTRALNPCTEATTALGRPPRLEVTALVGCSAALGRRVEVTLDGKAIEARRYQDVPKESAGEVLIHLRPTTVDIKTFEVTAVDATAHSFCGGPHRWPSLVGGAGAGLFATGAILVGLPARAKASDAQSLCPGGHDACPDDDAAASATWAAQLPPRRGGKRARQPRQ